MNEDLENFNDWFSVNKLSLNIDKTKYTVFCTRNMADNLPLQLPNLIMTGKVIEITISNFFWYSNRSKLILE